MTHPYNDDLTNLVSCIATSFGDEIGQAVNEKFQTLLSLEGVDVHALQQQIATLNSIVSASGDQAATVQALISQLSTMGGRLSALEASTAVADLTAVVATLRADLTAETASRVSGDAALQESIDTINTSLAQARSQIVALQNAPAHQACDCEALTGSLAQHAADITNLKASDAQQAQQIADLQAAVVVLQTKAADIVAAKAAADAAAAAAAAAADAKAVAAKAAADLANDRVSGLTTDLAGLRAENEEAHGHFVRKEEVLNIDCVAVTQAFRGAMRLRMFGPGNY